MKDKWSHSSVAGSTRVLLQPTLTRQSEREESKERGESEERQRNKRAFSPCHPKSSIRHYDPQTYVLSAVTNNV